MRFLVLPLALACGFQAPRIWATLWQTPAPNFDRAFLSLMQEHYKGEMASDWRGKLSQTYPGLMITNGFSAIGMAQQALERAKNLQVLKLARRIVAAESERVEQLQIHLMGGR